MDEATHFALRTILEALHDSGALSEKAVRQVVHGLRSARGTFGGENDDRISSELENLAKGIEHDLNMNFD